MPPVPMTLQTLAVVGAGLVLGARDAGLAALVYLLLVVLGLPVLADGESAMGARFLELKSAGYVAGFVPGAWVAGRLGAGRGWLGWIGAGLAGHAVVLGCGGAVLAGWIGLSPALAYGVYPFLPGAVVKSALAAGLGWATRRRPSGGPSAGRQA
ncbi:MAG: biotin transporter BioY [Alphaproteobacteria bacterium]|nr:biotin transporter BioY [Alphaproteobacteria bacterium]